MKLRTRFEHFLAKIAGEEVDIETLTPPVPVNTTEELMLKIADRINKLWEQCDVDYLCFTAEEAGSTLAMTKQDDRSPVVNLEYSFDKNNWAPFIVDETTVTLENIGDKVYLRGNNTTFCEVITEVDDYGEPTADVLYYNYFVMTGLIAASGNIMSIFDKTANSVSFIKSAACSDLFYECDSLTSAPELPATTLTENCYNYMFEECTSLTSAPRLPATTLAENCYFGMFYGCSNLTTAPELPATTLAENCYTYMFEECTSLTTAPKLPATTLAEGCYVGMFEECTSLTEAPELPATTLAGGCYNSMFEECTNLTEAPELPATTLAEWCYCDIFKGCTNLTEAPELPATTLAGWCYNNMFYDCTSLNKIKVRFTDWESDSTTTGWLSDVASTGTFYCPSALDTTTRDGDHIPENWTVVNF